MFLLWKIKWCNIYKRTYKGGKEHRTKSEKKKESIPRDGSSHNSWLESMLLDPVAGQFALCFSINSLPESNFASPFHQSPHTYFTSGVSKRLLGVLVFHHLLPLSSRQNKYRWTVWDDDVLLPSALKIQTIRLSETLSSTDESTRRQNPEAQHQGRWNFMHARDEKWISIQSERRKRQM